MANGPFDLSGEVAFVTGGNGGIGRAIAIALAAAGADVIVAARDAAKSGAVVDEVTAAGNRCLAVPCDVSRRESVGSAVERATAAFGKLTIVVNNAGFGRVAAPDKLSEDDWDLVLDTNLKGAFLASQACFPALQANGRGKVINIGSEYSLFGSTRNVPYSVSKGGLMTLTYSLADAWARHNIQVNAILPGIIDTDIWGGSLDEPDLRQRMERRTPPAASGCRRTSAMSPSSWRRAQPTSSPVNGLRSMADSTSPIR